MKKNKKRRIIKTLKERNMIKIDSTEEENEILFILKKKEN